MLFHIAKSVARHSYGVALVVTLAVAIIALTVHSKSNSMTVGIYYHYINDETFTITEELTRIADDGFKIVSVPYVWHDDGSSSERIKTLWLMREARRLGLEIYVRQPDTASLLKYLQEYGEYISYFQTINEADAQLLKHWYVIGELVTISESNAHIIKSLCPHIKTVASFTTPLLPNLVSPIAQHVDIIALDIYEQIQLDTFPLQLQTLLTLSNKDTIWIGEFGYASLDDTAQTNFIINGLNLFAKNGVETTIVWMWKDNVGLRIKGRPAEQAIANWIKIHK